MVELHVYNYPAQKSPLVVTGALFPKAFVLNENIKRTHCLIKRPRTK